MIFLCLIFLWTTIVFFLKHFENLTGTFSVIILHYSIADKYKKIEKSDIKKSDM